jgi:aryl-alcohol dehydrogenase-like predicted oxidoreductase
MVKTLRFGDKQVPVPGFGAMGLNSYMGADLDLEQSEPVLLKAIELGCTFWDTAVSSPFNSPKVLVSNVYWLGCLQGWRK